MKKKLLNISAFILANFLISCQVETNPCSLSKEVIKDIAELDSLVNVPEIQKRNREWNKANYNEPAIFDAKNEMYRFIWDSSFDGAEVYRIEKKSKRYKAIIKKYDDNDSIQSFTEFEISKEVWTSITDSLNRTNFWTYTYSIDRSGFDGSSWILEGYKPIKNKCTLKNYHYIDRWFPIDTTFINMCRLFRKLDKI